MNEGNQSRSFKKLAQTPVCNTRSGSSSKSASSKDRNVKHCRKPLSKKIGNTVSLTSGVAHSASGSAGNVIDLSDIGDGITVPNNSRTTII